MNKLDQGVKLMTYEYILEGVPDLNLSWRIDYVEVFFTSSITQGELRNKAFEIGYKRSVLHPSDIITHLILSYHSKLNKNYS
jgi:hypothetical protein